MARSVQPSRRNLRAIAISLLLGIGVSFSAWALSPVRTFLAENRLEEAIGLCRQYELLSTNDNDGFIACGWIYARTKRVDSAEKLMERMRRSSGLPEYQLLSAFIKMQKQKYPEAKKILDPLLVEHKGSAFALTAKEVYAEYYELQGQLPTAAFFYKQVVGDDPKRARSHWGLARYYLGQGDTGRALLHLETTAKLWKRHVASRYDLAVLHLSVDNVQEAAKWLSEAYKLNRADTGVLEQMGVLFEKKGMVTEAVKYWQRAVELSKDATLAKEKLGVYFTQVIDNLIETGKYAQAMRQIEMSGKTINDQPQLLKRRGMIYRATGKYDKAAGDLKAYFSSKPESDPAAARELGICYVNLKLLDQAKEFFAKAVQQEPENGINHAWVAYVLESRGELEPAREEMRLALDLLRDPKEIEKATRKLASLEKRIGKKEKSDKKKKEKMDMGLTKEPPSEEEE